MGLTSFQMAPQSNNSVSSGSKTLFLTFLLDGFPITKILTLDKTLKIFWQEEVFASKPLSWAKGTCHLQGSDLEVDN